MNAPIVALEGAAALEERDRIQVHGGQAGPRGTTLGVVPAPASSSEARIQDHMAEFTAGAAYRRADIYELLGVPELKQDGAWNRGYREWDGEMFIFARGLFVYLGIARSAELLGDRPVQTPLWVAQRQASTTRTYYMR